MSEEEIIEIVNEIKNHQIAVFDPKENIQITRNYFTEKQRQALQGLLDLYNKEKEKNKKLEIELEIKKYCKVDELTRDLIYYKNLAKEYQGNCISKDKIRERIKELEKENEEKPDSYRQVIIIELENILEEKDE